MGVTKEMYSKAGSVRRSVPLRRWAAQVMTGQRGFVCLRFASPVNSFTPEKMDGTTQVEPDHRVFLFRLFRQFSTIVGSHVD